ncbi:uncharacterized protein LOC114828075 [Galendromus occidentalis]|uniref:Uncharacterized protein LOC114828075 n=1 Tax=Galendromus occidentalis TaxID=34638 RepID=A0AAJ7SF23_9ACAR|nr:uncharacterized protein LOC114828075 [Galendromus occidentalis]
MRFFALAVLCIFACLAALAEAGGHYAVAGDFGYKVEVKHPSHVSHDSKGHHHFVEDKGIQEQYIKVGIYPHVEAHGYVEDGHGYEH